MATEGIELLSDAARFLNDYNLFRGHLWWHLSLFKLSQGRFDEVLDLFDREVYPQSSTFYLDVQNGASLLARWERLAQASVHIPRAIKKLQELAPNVVWWRNTSQPGQYMATQEAVMAMDSSGRMNGMLDKGVPLKIVSFPAVIGHQQQREIIVLSEVIDEENSEGGVYARVQARGVAASSWW